MSYVRKPHKKTKTGCTSCKKRRIKCDETKPICLRCQKRQLECTYIPVPPKSGDDKCSINTSLTHSPTIGSNRNSNISSNFNTTSSITNNNFNLNLTDNNADDSTHNYNNNTNPLINIQIPVFDLQMPSFDQHFQQQQEQNLEQQQQRQQQHHQRQLQPQFQIPILRQSMPYTLNQPAPSFPSTSTASPSIFYSNDLNFHTNPTIYNNASLISPNLNQLSYNDNSQNQVIDDHNLPPSQSSACAPPYNLHYNQFLHNSDDNIIKKYGETSILESKININTNNSENIRRTSDSDVYLNKLSETFPESNTQSILTSEPNNFAKGQSGCFTTLSNNKFEKFYKKESKNINGDKTSTQENHHSYTNITLPQCSIKSLEKNSSDVVHFFENVKIKESLSDSNKNLHLNEALNGYFNPAFITPNFNLSSLSNTHINNQILSYACYFELNMKVQQYCRSSLPFKMTNDKFAIQLILVSLENSVLFEPLFHIFLSLSYISLYHESFPNRDSILGFNHHNYLMLSDYHLLRSVQSLNTEITLEETCRRSCVLYMIPLYHIFCLLAQPDFKVATKTFLMLYKNIEFIYNKFFSYFGECPIFLEGLERFHILNYSKSADVYFPSFIYDLVDISFPRDSSSVKKYFPELSDFNKNILTEAINRLQIVYKSFRNKTRFDHQFPGNYDYNTEGEIFEDDIFFCVHRLFYRISSEFIDLVSIGDPRALILVSYHLLYLSSKKNNFFSKSFFKTELDFIVNKLENIQYSDCWIAWLSPVIIAFSE